MVSDHGRQRHQYRKVAQYVIVQLIRVLVDHIAFARPL
jgi:hypothetical protein